MSTKGTPDTKSNKTSNNSQQSSQEHWAEVEKIIEERGGLGSKKQYKVVWAGADSEGKPFEPSWVEKENITNDLLVLWGVERATKIEERERKAAKLAEDRLRRQRKAEVARQQLQSSRAARAQKRQRARRDLSPPSPRFDGTPNTIETSSSASTTSDHHTPPPKLVKRKPRNIIVDPEDTDSIPTPAKASSEKANITTPITTAHPLAGIPVPLLEVPAEDYDRFSSSFRTVTSAIESEDTLSSTQPSKNTQPSNNSSPKSSPSNLTTAPVAKLVVPDSQSQGTGPGTGSSKQSALSTSEPDALSTSYSEKPSQLEINARDLFQSGSNDEEVISAVVKETPAKLGDTSLLIDESVFIPKTIHSTQTGKNTSTTSDIPNGSAKVAIPPKEDPTNSTGLHLSKSRFSSLYRYLSAEHRKALEEGGRTEPQVPEQNNTVSNPLVPPQSDCSGFETQIPHSIVLTASSNGALSDSQSNESSARLQPIHTPVAAYEGSRSPVVINKTVTQSRDSSTHIPETCESNTSQQDHISINGSNDLGYSVLQDAQVVTTPEQSKVVEADIQGSGLDLESENESAHFSRSRENLPTSPVSTGINLTETISASIEHDSSWLQAPPAVSEIMADSKIPARPQTPSDVSTITPFSTSTTSQATSIPYESFASRRARSKAKTEELRKERAGRASEILLNIQPLSLKTEAWQSPSRNESPSAKGAVVLDSTSVSKPSSRIPSPARKVDNIRQETVIDVSLSTIAPSITHDDLVSRQPGETPRNLDFFVPIALTSTQKPIYDGLFSFNRKTLQQFTSETHPTDEMMASVREIVEKFHLAAFQTDLVSSPSMTQEQYAPTFQADWDVSNSDKFRLLRLLLTRLVNSDKHIVIFVKSRRASDKVEMFLEGSNVTYNRPEEHRRFRSSNSSIRVTLLSTHGHQIVERADLVIGMDETFSLEDTQVVQVRKHMLEVNKLCPVLSLVAVYTMEHIRRTLDQKTTEQEQLKVLILQAARMREQALTMSFDDEYYTSIVLKVAAFLSSTSKTDFGLPTLDGFEVSSPNDTQSTEFTSIETSALEQVIGKRKRSYDKSNSDAGDKDDHKKLRVASPTIYDEPSSTVSCVADSGKAPDSSTEHVMDHSIVPPMPESSIAELLGAALKREAMLQGQVSSLESSTIDFQRRYDEQLLELKTLRKNLAATTAALTTSETRQITLRESNVTLKADKILLQSELESARKEMATSVIPEIQEMERLRGEARRGEEMKRKLDLQLASQKRDCEYLRENYQNASRLATEHADNARTLESANIELGIQATGHTVELRKMYTDTALNQAVSEASRLKRQLDDAQKLLTNIQLENNQLKERLEKRAGMSLSTRASSLPPKAVGSVLKSPGGATATQATVGGHAMVRVPSALRGQVTASGTPVASKAGSRAGSRAASRQGSPAVGGGGAGNRMGVASFALQERLVGVRKARDHGS